MFWRANNLRQVVALNNGDLPVLYSAKIGLVTNLDLKFKIFPNIGSCWRPFDLACRWINRRARRKLITFPGVRVPRIRINYARLVIVWTASCDGFLRYARRGL